MTTLAAAAALVGVALPSPAAAGLSCTWNRTTGTNTFNASTTYWSCGAIPGSADDVIFGSAFDGSCTISPGIVVNSITIQSGYTGTITQASSATVTLNGAFSQAGGTFAGGDNKITIGGNFALSNGTFTSTTHG